MNGLIDWTTSRARMIMTFVIASLVAGIYAYTTIPKEGSPDIDIPVLFVSAPYPGISAEDSERLMVRPLESRLSEVKGVTRMSSTAAEGYAGVALEFEFDWDREATIADVRDKVNRAQSDMPDGVGSISINEINFSEFPVLVIALSGNLPERTLVRAARSLQTEIENITTVLEAGIAGNRDEMLEVVIDPLKLEAYNITAGELIAVVRNNNQLIAAGEVEVGSGSYAIKIPSAFTRPQNVFDLPVKTEGDMVVTLGDIADIRLTFEDRRGTARFNGTDTLALQVVMRKGANIIDTVAQVRAVAEAHVATWPEPLRQALRIEYTLDNSIQVRDMVNQLLASVLTAIALVMITVLAALGIRSALLVGFAIPTSFLLTFALMAMLGISISNIVMFAMILAVGMLVDGAIVVVEFADKKIQQGVGPMRAYAAASKRMFWPIVSSTATTLCAFLPFLFWPGVAGQFMGALPVTIIFVLSASLLVALIYLPVVGGVTGRITRTMDDLSAWLRGHWHWAARLLLLVAVAGLMVMIVLELLRGGGLMTAALLALALMALSAVAGSLRRARRDTVAKAGYRRSPFGWIIHAIVGNPVMPVVVLMLTAGVVGGVGYLYATYGKGIEFFVETEPERAVAFVRARGNLSLEEKDRLVRLAEAEVMSVPGVEYVFSFAGSGGLTQFDGGATRPVDTIGDIQIELAPYDLRGPGKDILAEIDRRLRAIPGVDAQIVEQSMGPAASRPINLKVQGDNWADLLTSVAIIRDRLDSDPQVNEQEDTRPLPGIDWQINVDVAQAGRFGTDVVGIGGTIQLVTRGLTLGTMRTEGSDSEIDIRVRFPEADRLLSTIDTLRVRTPQGLVPLSNFVTREPVPQLAQINRSDKQRTFTILAGVVEGVNATEKILELTEWLNTPGILPDSITWSFGGDFADQNESIAFLQVAFMAAMALMFIILLAQFNSFYNSVLVLVAVVLSTTGVLIGMLVMGQTFSAVMTGTGVVALAGIVVNNNIVLIDTFQEYNRYMPRLQAIVRTAEDRIRPVLLTTITTIAGLTPMMLGISVDFINGGYSVDAPAAVWWKSLATAVVFGLATATVLTLVVTPSLLSLRYWIGRGVYGSLAGLAAFIAGRDSDARRDRRLRKWARRTPAQDIVWPGGALPRPQMVAPAPGRAAE